MRLTQSECIARMKHVLDLENNHSKNPKTKCRKAKEMSDINIDTDIAKELQNNLVECLKNKKNALSKHKIMYFEARKLYY